MRLNLWWPAMCVWPGCLRRPFLLRFFSGTAARSTRKLFPSHCCPSFALILLPLLRSRLSGDTLQYNCFAGQCCNSVAAASRQRLPSASEFARLHSADIHSVVAPHTGNKSERISHKSGSRNTESQRLYNSSGDARNNNYDRANSGRLCFSAAAAAACFLSSSRTSSTGVTLTHFTRYSGSTNCCIAARTREPCSTLSNRSSRYNLSTRRDSNKTSSTSSSKLQSGSSSCSRVSSCSSRSRGGNTSSETDNAEENAVADTAASTTEMGTAGPASQQESSVAVPAALQGKCCFVDIGVNLTDDMYQGVYHGHKKHPPDLQSVIARARAVGCTRLLVTGGSFEDSKKALSLCRSLDPEGQFLFTTVGVHPTRCGEFVEPPEEVGGEGQPQDQRSAERQTQQQTRRESQQERSDYDRQNRALQGQEQGKLSVEQRREQLEQKQEPGGLHEAVDAISCAEEAEAARVLESHAEAHLKELCASLSSSTQFTPASLRHLRQLYLLIARNRDRVAAIGEIGLDNDRTHFCALNTQKRYFELQLLLSRCFSLPLFLHMRAADKDFCEILTRNKPLWESSGGVVHSFTGDKAALDDILSLSPALSIGVNGCSLKTAENLDVVRHIPLQRLHLETDAPWCEIRPTHAGFAVLQQQQPDLLAWAKCKAEKWSEDAQVKSRNEPCNIAQVAVVVHKLTAPELPFEEFCSIVQSNSLRTFTLLGKNVAARGT